MNEKWKKKGGGGSDYVVLSRVLQGNGDGNFDYLWNLAHLNVLRRDTKKGLYQLSSTNVLKFCPSETQIGFSFAWRMKNITEYNLKATALSRDDRFQCTLWRRCLINTTRSLILFTHEIVCHVCFLSLQCILESLLLNIEVLYANHWRKKIIETPKFQISPSPSIYGCKHYTSDCLSFAHEKLNEYRSPIKEKRKKNGLRMTNHNWGLWHEIRVNTYRPRTSSCRVG